jgi:ribonuclease D
MPPSDAERLITTPSARDALAAALTPHTRLALDTESNSMFAHTERLCLVQLAWGDAADPAVSAIDPLAFGPREAVREALGPVVDFWRDPARTIVAHGAGYDVAILRRDLGEAPRRLFDTQIAATLLGLPRTGYAPLVGELLGAQLSKSHQQHDWGLRPIPAAALTYAFNDARHLLRLADALTERVTAADLVEEVALACAAVLETAPHAPRPPDEAFWRLALGDGPPPPRPALLRLAVLFSWREALAARLDHPAGRVLNSALALELARRPPEDEATLKRRLPGRISETDRAALFSALSQAESQATLPPRPPRPPEVKPAVRAREKALKAWREATATARGVGAQAILPTPTLTWLAERGPAGLADAPQLGEARLRRYGAAIREVLARNP